MYSNETIRPSEINEYDTGDMLDFKVNKNDDILYFEDEGIIETINPRQWKGWPDIIYNRALSGWYVVTEMEINYDPEDNNLKMNLTLNRIEYKPCFKHEYTRAQKAIEKYKNENNLEDILILK